MSATRIQAVYRDTGVEAYRDNPFIEALPPLQESVNSAASLKSSLQLTSSDLQKSRVIRAHTICRIPDDYFRKRKLTAVCSHQTRIGNLDAHLI